jgi:hypothetical protein
MQGEVQGCDQGMNPAQKPVRFVLKSKSILVDMSQGQVEHSTESTRQADVRKQ